jgi:hypothetical protein
MPSFAASIMAKPSTQAAAEPYSHFFVSLTWAVAGIGRELADRRDVAQGRGQMFRSTSLRKAGSVHVQAREDGEKHLGRGHRFVVFQLGQVGLFDPRRLRKLRLGQAFVCPDLLESFTNHVKLS